MKNSEVVIIGTRSADRVQMSSLLRSDQIVIDLINLEAARPPKSAASYQDIC
ncbi:MAG: hypothetical protein ACRD2U_11465 [Terriglobales bacterium]